MFNEQRLYQHDCSYECTCNIGYSGDGKVCEDVDKCLDNPRDVN